MAPVQSAGQADEFPNFWTDRQTASVALIDYQAGGARWPPRKHSGIEILWRNQLLRLNCFYSISRTSAAMATISANQQAMLKT
jgi:hypothetical protein